MSTEKTIHNLRFADDLALFNEKNPMEKHLNSVNSESLTVAPKYKRGKNT